MPTHYLAPYPQATAWATAMYIGLFLPWVAMTHFSTCDFKTYFALSLFLPCSRGTGQRLFQGLYLVSCFFFSLYQDFWPKSRKLCSNSVVLIEALILSGHYASEDSRCINYATHACVLSLQSFVCPVCEAQQSVLSEGVFYILRIKIIACKCWEFRWSP